MVSIWTCKNIVVNSFYTLRVKLSLTYANMIVSSCMLIVFCTILSLEEGGFFKSK